MRIYIIFFALFFHACTFAQEKYSSNLSSESAFKNFSGLPLSAKYGQVSSVKVVYDLKKHQLYFLNGKIFKFHHQFVRRHIDPALDLRTFNDQNYTLHDKRRYLLGNINYYHKNKVYALELSPADIMDFKHTKFLWDRIITSSYLNRKLKLFVNNTRLKTNQDKFKGQISLLYPEEIYKNLTYQAIYKTKSYGRLHIINDLKKEIDDIRPNDIIILKETPLFLPKVSGVIINEFQTPLSHLMVLGQNRKLAIAAHKDILSYPKLKEWNLQNVSFEVFRDTFYLKRIDSLPEQHTRVKKINLRYNLKADSVIGVEHFDRYAYKYVGNKAANFGELNKLSKRYNFKVPEGAFAIPFYFYNEHIINSNAQLLIIDFLNDKGSIQSVDSIKSRLKAIRKAIKEAEVDKELLNSVYQKCKAASPYTRFRFRSSTNAEDAPGFSGAGLYKSKTGIVDSDEKPIDKAIKKVWASLWSYEAFYERELYEIKHTQVYMGILVHRAFPNELANGVAITKNLYRPDCHGFVVNAQLGDESVVLPKASVVTDQFICYSKSADKIYANKGLVEIITQSNLNNGQLVMKEEEIMNLAEQLESLKHYYYVNTYSPLKYIDFALDIEFKIDGPNRQLYIKQVRLFND